MIKLPDTVPLMTYSHKLRSRFGETDKMGYVYYGRYLDYFEVARTEMIRAVGYPYTRLEEEGVMLPVIYSQAAYKMPVFYDEEMTIDVLIYKKPVVRLETFYKVFTPRNKTPHIIGRVDLCFTDSESRKPCRAPDEFIDFFEKS